MVVPTIALYPSPPSSVCSTPHPCQINAHVCYDFDLSSRSSSTASSTASTSQKHVVGGLSCLFSSTTVRHATSNSGLFCGRDELGSLWHDRSEELKELNSSFRYSPGKFNGLSSSKEQSPVSVLQGPVSCSSGGVVARSAPLSIARERSGDVNFQVSLQGGSNGVFKGYVKNTLGSCVGYDSPSFEVRRDALDVGSSAGMVDELTFNMEDSLAGGNSQLYAKDLLLGAQLIHKIFCEDFVVKAFYEAEKAHRGQMRASGDPYLQHCVETAVLLALIGANSTVVAAGLLHDTLDDSSVCYDYILAAFGPGVADLVEGVSKLSHLSKLARENNTASKSAEADRLHTMFLAMADARAVLIKLADRLHNMMTLDALPLAKRQRFAKETLEIFAPLANRLGISSWKEQLENLCFKHLNPDEYKDLSSKLVVSFDEAMIRFAIDKLEEALQVEGVPYHLISGRHKSLYSVYRKMLKKNLSMDEIHDIHGLRLIVESEEDCYKAVEVVHKLWSEVPGRLKDYISHPKFNGYRSLHTVVVGEGMVPLEVQIRTKEMHLQAEFGFAAHWRYKEGDCKHSLFVLQMVEWARWVITWQCETMGKDHSSIGYSDCIKPPCKFPSHSDDCPYSYKPHCGQDGPVFVIILENDEADKVCGQRCIGEHSRDLLLADIDSQKPVSLDLHCGGSPPVRLWDDPASHVGFALQLQMRIWISKSRFSNATRADFMSVQEFPGNSTVADVLERTGRGSLRWTPRGFRMKEDLRARLNHEPVSDPKCKLQMGDVVELSPAIPDKSLTDYREEIQRMYDRGLTISREGTAATSMAGWRS